MLHSRAGSSTRRSSPAISTPPSAARAVTSPIGHQRRNTAMKIATWNLESVRPLTKDRLEVFQSTMRVVNPDVWILTETWEDFTPGDKYQRVAVSRSAGDLKNSLGRCWVAIWAKLDLSAESLDNHGQKDRMACAICTKPGQTRVVVVGTVPCLGLATRCGQAGMAFVGHLHLRQLIGKSCRRHTEIAP
jgi:hypothetical protein